jgi:hypothetical protein
MVFGPSGMGDVVHACSEWPDTGAMGVEVILLHQPQPARQAQVVEEDSNKCNPYIHGAQGREHGRW